MNFFRPYIYTALLLYSTQAMALDPFFPQGGLFYQSHIGGSIYAGLGYAAVKYSRDSGGAYNGPYTEVGIGMHGQSVDVGWTQGLGGWFAIGGGLSYLHINKEASYFNVGNYIGASAKGTFMGLSLRLGIYHEPSLNDNRVSFGVGIGL